MAANFTPPSERVQGSFRELATAAINLNHVSDELGKTIDALDIALQKLNLGISAWVVITGNSDPNGYYWSRGLGYAKVGQKWGIALRDVEGWDALPEEERRDTWLFNDAPRWMRVEAIDKIPDLLEALVKQANETTDRIRKKTVEAKDLTAAIKALAVEPKTAARK